MRVPTGCLTQQVQPSRPGYGFGPVGRVKLAIDAVDVGLDRTQGDEKIFGDLGVGFSGGQEGEDFQFPLTQRVVQARLGSLVI